MWIRQKTQVEVVIHSNKSLKWHRAAHLAIRIDTTKWYRKGVKRPRKQPNIRRD